MDVKLGTDGNTICGCWNCEHDIFEFENLSFLDAVGFEMW